MKSQRLRSCFLRLLRLHTSPFLFFLSFLEQSVSCRCSSMSCMNIIHVASSVATVLSTKVRVPHMFPGLDDFKFIMWMCFTDTVIERLLTRISESHQRLDNVFGTEPLDAFNFSIRGFRPLVLGRLVVVYHVCSRSEASEDGADVSSCLWPPWTLHANLKDIIRVSSVQL